MMHVAVNCQEALALVLMQAWIVRCQNVSPCLGFFIRRICEFVEKSPIRNRVDHLFTLEGAGYYLKYSANKHSSG